MHAVEACTRWCRIDGRIPVLVGWVNLRGWRAGGQKEKRRKAQKKAVRIGTA